jgi:hypothetical protein
MEVTIKNVSRDNYCVSVMASRMATTSSRSDGRPGWRSYLDLAAGPSGPLRSFLPRAAYERVR